MIPLVWRRHVGTAVVPRQATPNEATAYYSNRFTELDSNGDGFLDAKELEPLIPVMNAQSAKELLFKLDRNSDNKLSRPEFLVIVNWLFQLASSPYELADGDAPPAARVDLPELADIFEPCR
jgi:Ca2+-binding EF-hand superfamily protein